MPSVVITLALLVLTGLLALFFAFIFVIALIETIKEMRKPKPLGINAGLGFRGELGVKLIKKGQPIPQ